MISNLWKKNIKLCTLMKIEIKKNISKENKIELKMEKYSRLKVKKAMEPWIQALIRIKADQEEDLAEVKVEVAKETH